MKPVLLMWLLLLLTPRADDPTRLDWAMAQMDSLSVEGVYRGAAGAVAASTAAGPRLVVASSRD